MEINRIYPYQKIEKTDILKSEEKQNLKIEKQKPECASSLEAMSLSAQGGIKSKYHNMQIVRIPQILSNTEKYLYDAKNKQKKAEELLQYGQGRIRQLKLMPGNKPEILTERKANGDTLIFSYNRGKNNIKINDIKVTKQDGSNEYYIFSPFDDTVSRISIQTKTQDGEIEKLYQYLNEPTTLYIKKSVKGMVQEHIYYFDKNSLSTFENKIKTQKSIFNEIFKLTEGKIIDYNVSSKKIN